jgi:hypothetical protein
LGLRLTETRPADPDLYREYTDRCGQHQEGFLIPGIPIYFVVPPRQGRGFTTELSLLGESFDEKGVELRFERAGLDFQALSLKRWRSSTLRSKLHDERLLRHCALRWIAHDRVEILGAPCSFRDYLNTEAAVNLRVRDGHASQNLRPVLEGEHWNTGRLRLDDFGHTSQHFAAAVSVAVLLETSDNYLVLQRRSSRVLHGSGNLACSASGFVSWDRDVIRSDDTDGAMPVAAQAPVSLWPAVLREIHEEIGLQEHHLLLHDHRFIGAAYNLLHARDLNSYASVKSLLTRSAIREMIHDAPDHWEHSELVFVPIDALSPSGAITGGLKDLTERCNRHLRAALYSIALTKA